MIDGICAKSEIGRQHLHSFRYFCADFPSGELLQQEAPDFLVTAETGTRIGIEFTRVFKERGKAAEQSVEATKDAITIAARRYAEDHFQSPPAHVTLFFTLSRHLNNEHCQRIAERVAQAVHDNMPATGESTELHYRSGGVQPIEVDLIQINRVYPVTAHQWCWLEFSSIKTDAVEVLEQEIQAKNKKYDQYHRKCEECWLVIVAPSFRSSGNVCPDDESYSHIYPSRFDRTYFLNIGRGCLTQLQTIPSNW
jgi:hypothetical protein